MLLLQPKKTLFWFTGSVIYCLFVSGLFEARAIWKHMKALTNGLYRLQQIALQRGVPFDQRTPLEAYEDLLKEYPTAVTHLPESLFISGEETVTIQGRPAEPLGNVSREIVLGEGESGEWRHYQTDERGFRNPTGLYSQAPVELVILGDSFSVGASVVDGETIAGFLRRRFPKTVNLGVVDFGPLAELATLKEYGLALKPKVVIWLYYDGNDVPGLGGEMTSPILKRYVADEHFSQRLSTHQGEIDAQLRKISHQRYDSFRKQSLWSQFQRAAADFPAIPMDILLFRPVRRSLRLIEPLGMRTRDNGTPDELRMFGEVAQAMKRACVTIGAELTFVYLPEWMTMRDGERARTDRPEVLTKIRRLGITIVDGVEAFKKGGDPLAYYPLRSHGHYNSDGNRIIAEAIQAQVLSEKSSTPARRHHPN